MVCGGAVGASRVLCPLPDPLKYGFAHLSFTMPSWVRSNTHSGPGGGQITPGRAPPTTTLPKQGALLCLDAWLVVEMEEEEQS